MEGTSIFEGLVKPQCSVNCKYEEFIFMPAFVHLLNYLTLRVSVEGHTQTTGILLVNIGERGRALKSASCDLAFDYMFHAGLGRKFSKRLTPTDMQGRSLIVTAGSPEGFLGKMATLDCAHGILYYDELSKLVSKASIESSSLVPDLCTMLESGEFGSITLRNSPVLSAGEYCVSAIMNVPRKHFRKVWGQLENEQTGLNDRAFFLLEPQKVKVITPRVDVSFAQGIYKTRELVDAAVERGVIGAGDWTLFNTSIERLGNRAEVRAEIFAMGFAVELGRAVVDDDCKRRGIALAEYDVASKLYLHTIESENKEGALQQEMVLYVAEAGDKVEYRKFCQDLNYMRYGTTIWERAFFGLTNGEQPQLRFVKGTRGSKGTPAMVYLIPENCMLD